VEGVLGFCLGEKIKAGKPTGQEALVFFVRRKLPLGGPESPTVILPQSIGSIPTDVVEVGDLRAQSFTERMRPAPAGASVGHFKVTAGTLGLWVAPMDDGKALLLASCRHVLAPEGFNYGDAILQPGVYDGGGFAPQDDTVATLSFAAPLHYDRPLVRLLRVFGFPLRNEVDFALATPLRQSDATREIVGRAGYPRRVRDVESGERVFKVGRTTEFTQGACRYVGATLTVGYDAGPATFENVNVYAPFSEGGDSGSAILSQVDQGQTLHDFLFAGSEQVTVGFRAAAAFERAGVRLP
jgi:hypothetical protein